MLAVRSAPASNQFPTPIAEVVEQAVDSVFTSICGQKPKCQRDADGARPWSGVLGTISFLGDPAWTMSLMLPEAMAPQLVERFAGFSIPYDSLDMGDVVGELANVLAGDIVARCEARRIEVQMSLPMVARGHDIEMLSPKGLPDVRLVCEVGEGRFWVKLAAAKHEALPGRRPGS